MTRTDKGSVVPRFKVGAKVRVQPGVNDPEFPDSPLGGWAEEDRYGLIGVGKEPGGPVAPQYAENDEQAATEH